MYRGHEILPCGDRKSLEDCFSYMGNRLVFWFNTSGDNSTRMVHTVVTYRL